MTPRFLRSFFVCAAITGLAVAACSSAGTVTSRPTVPISTRAPTEVKTTVGPAKPTQAPTEVKPTAAPTSAPTQRPTAVPTLPAENTPASQPTALPTEPALALGHMQAIGDLSVTPSKYDVLTTSGTDKPKAGNDFLVVTIAIQNNSKTDSLKFDPAMLSLFNPAGSAAFTAVTLKSLPKELQAQTLKPGQSVSGVVAYEVPHSWKGLELKFANQDHSVFWMLAG